MVNLHFLVTFPRLDQAGSTLVAHVDATARRSYEIVGAYLSTANPGNDEPVCQRSQFFGKVEGQRWPAGPRPVQKSHLVVQADALSRADKLGYQTYIAEPEHGIDRIAGWPTGSLRKPHLALRDNLTHPAKIDPRSISFYASNPVASVRIDKS